MPLVEATLAASVLNILENPSNTEAGIAQQWADALTPYVTPIVPPSTTAAAAAGAMATNLIGMAVADQGATVFNAAFATFGAGVAGGMVGGVPLPPAGSLSPVPGPQSSTRQAAADNIAGTIDAWLRTGTFTIPPGAPVPWS